MQRTPSPPVSTHSSILTEKDETGTHCQSPFFNRNNAKRILIELP